MNYAPIATPQTPSDEPEQLAADPGSIFKQLTVKVFHPGKKRPEIGHFRAPNGKAFRDHVEDTMLHRVAENLEELYPGIEFRMVKVGARAFNFLPDAKKTLQVLEARLNETPALAAGA